MAGCASEGSSQDSVGAWLRKGFDPTTFGVPIGCAMQTPFNPQSPAESFHQPGLEYWLKERRTLVDFRRGPLGRLQKPPLPIATLYRQIVKLARDRGEQAPSYGTVFNIVRSLPADLVTLAHEGTKAYSNTFELVHRREAERPNSIWQADHTPLDILLVRPDGRNAKPWLTTVIDDYSRAIAGYFLSFEDPSILHTSLALRQAIWRKQEPRWIVCGIPLFSYSDCDVYAAIRHLPEDHRHGYWRARSICNGVGRAAHRDQRPIRIPPRRAGHDRRRSVPQLGVRGIPADYSLPRASVDDAFWRVDDWFALVRRVGDRNRHGADRFDGSRNRRKTTGATGSRVGGGDRGTRCEFRVFVPICYLRLSVLGAGGLGDHSPAEVRR